ncbi:hypothetical protein SP39_13 [Salmonella phage 39]|nr:hypothetical protein SP39_13 [Salmonella phage 39]
MLATPAEEMRIHGDVQSVNRIYVLKYQPVPYLIVLEVDDFKRILM